MLNPQLRRRLAVMLAAAGAALIFLAPDTWASVALLLMGIAFDLKNLNLSTKNTKDTKYGNKLRAFGYSPIKSRCACYKLLDFVRGVRVFRGQLIF